MTASPQWSHRAAWPSVLVLQVEYQECLGSGSRQWQLVERQPDGGSSAWALSMVLPLTCNKTSHRSRPHRGSLFPTIFCRLNSLSPLQQGRSQSLWSSTMPSLLCRQKKKVVSQAQQGQSVNETLVSYCSLRQDWIGGFTTDYCWFASTNTFITEHTRKRKQHMKKHAAKGSL